MSLIRWQDFEEVNKPDEGVHYYLGWYRIDPIAVPCTYAQSDVDNNTPEGLQKLKESIHINGMQTIVDLVTIHYMNSAELLMFKEAIDYEIGRRGIGQSIDPV